MMCCYNGIPLCYQCTSSAVDCILKMASDCPGRKVRRPVAGPTSSLVSPSSSTQRTDTVLYRPLLRTTVRKALWFTPPLLSSVKYVKGKINYKNNHYT